MTERNIQTVKYLEEYQSSKSLYQEFALLVNGFLKELLETKYNANYLLIIHSYLNKISSE